MITPTIGGADGDEVMALARIKENTGGSGSAPESNPTDAPGCRGRGLVMMRQVECGANAIAREIFCPEHRTWMQNQ